MRDYAFEALAEVTSTDWNIGRGELNAALKSIREQSDVTDAYLLSAEIHSRAKLYRQVMGDAILTPSALAKHWQRVYEEVETRRFVNAANQAARPTQCATCNGDRLVVVSMRKPVTTSWMESKGFKANEDEMIEEYAPCPDCNADANTQVHRHDGTVFRSPDPARVKEMMSQ